MCGGDWVVLSRVCAWNERATAHPCERECPVAGHCLCACGCVCLSAAVSSLLTEDFLWQPRVLRLRSKCPLAPRANTHGDTCVLPIPAPPAGPGGQTTWSISCSCSPLPPKAGGGTLRGRDWKGGRWDEEKANWGHAGGCGLGEEAPTTPLPRRVGWAAGSGPRQASSGVPESNSLSSSERSPERQPGPPPPVHPPPHTHTHSPPHTPESRQLLIGCGSGVPGSPTRSALGLEAGAERARWEAQPGSGSRS